MSIELINELLQATWQTLLMVFVSTLIATVLGLPIGVLLLISKPKGILPNRVLYNITAAIVNATRSIPFIILLIAIVPLTRLIVGTSIGTAAAIVPLTIGAIPFIARIAESAMSEVPSGLIEAGKAMGASPLQIIYKILIPEALPSIVNGLTITIISLIGYSAMAGAIGGGGLGDFAIRYGYERFQVNVMIATVIVLIALVQLIQMLGDKLVAKIAHK